jgi:hypothetical protein
MIKLLLRQPLNIWRSLGRLNKIEIIILLGLVYAYLVGRIYHLFIKLLEIEWITPFRLSSLTAHLFIISIFISGPFIISYLVPRQQTLIPFFTQPLGKKDFFQITGYLYFKYQLLILLLAIPFISALIGLHWLAALLSLLSITLFSAVIFYAQIIFYAKSSGHFTFLNIQMMIIIAFYILYGIAYAMTGYPLIFDFIILTGTSLIIKLFYDRLPDPELEMIFSPSHLWMRKSKIGRIGFSNIPNIFPAKIQVLFKKELVGLWRNPAYRRLKVLTILAFFIFLVLIAISQVENKDIWMTVFTIIVIWIHYSNHFNEKYVQPEPEWFFKTIPVRFHQVWFSKFLTEAIYLAFILSLFWIVQIGVGLNFAEQLNLVGVVLIFSVFVLLVMLNFQIMFYEDPRLAGYAYHFTILFLVIISLNYKLVGPLISIILLSFYFYKSYKYFRA